MNLFISSSNYNKTPKPMIIGLIIFITLNVIIAWLPDSHYKLQFNGALNDAINIGDKVDVVLFGDSRATRFHHTFFNRNTLSFASDNNTIIYSNLLYDKMIQLTDCRPKVIIIVVGANNYSKNSIFTIRDFAIRRLVSIPDLIAFTSFQNGFNYMVDGLISRLIPIYGRRMEIRSPSLIKKLIVEAGRKKTLPGMEPLKPNVLGQVIKRDYLSDVNYKLIYRRSIYSNYELSLCHTGILEALINKAIINGSVIVLMQLPIEEEILDLQKELVGEIFDKYLEKLELDKGVIRLDMRNNTRFEMADNNHLSYKGAYQYTNDILNPLIDSLINSIENKGKVGQLRYDKTTN